jgi:putative CocE/NonD family hydrolase
VSSDSGVMPDSTAQRFGKKSRQSDAPWWADSWNPPHRFSGMRRTAAYVRAKDGTRIATYRYLPANLGETDRIPAILIITPYVSEVELTWFGKLVAPKSEQIQLAEEFARCGYATIFMDGRGSGASFGARRSSLFKDFVSYARDIVDWIIAQPWSNGKVGSTGVSAVGSASYWLAIGNHPAVKAIAPRFTSFDIFYDTHPGGLLTSRFVQDIDGKLKLMDSNQLWKLPDTRLQRAAAWFFVKGICPMDEDRDHSLLNEALSERAGNESLAMDIANAMFREDQITDASGATMLDSQSPFEHLRELESSGAAMYLFAGWFDGAFSRAMLNAFRNLANPAKKIVIGPWSHGGRQNSSPFEPGKGARKFDQSAELVRFFELHLRGEDNGIAKEPPIHYFTMGSESWQSTSEWPPSAAKMLRLHFNSERHLTDTEPGTDGCDTYNVDFRASTGNHSRFGKHLSGDRLRASYPDRRRRDRTLLTYDSAPLTRDVEITGHAIATLYVSSNREDSAFLVYLEDVWPDGKVYNITDGILSARFRKISSERPPYVGFGPYRTLKRSDEMPVVRGEIMELVIDMFPVSYLVSEGHRIRIALSGADVDNFPLVPPDAAPSWNVYWGGNVHASCIDLPVIEVSPRAQGTRLFKD